MTESLQLSFRSLSFRTWGNSSAEHEWNGKWIEKLRPWIDHFVDGISSVSTMTEEQTDSVINLIEESLGIKVDIVEDSSTAFFHLPWNTLSVVVNLLECVVQSMSVSDGNLRDILKRLVRCIQELLEHNEVRLRIQASTVIRLLVARILRGRILELMKTDIQEEQLSVKSSIPFIYSISESILQAIGRNWHRKESSRSTTLGVDASISMDDTTGWDKLESYLHAFYAVVEAIGQGSAQTAAPNTCNTFPAIAFLYTVSLPAETDFGVSARDGGRCFEVVITLAGQHVNRHIREGMFRFLAAIFTSADSNATDFTNSELTTTTTTATSTATTSCRYDPTCNRSPLHCSATAYTHVLQACVAAISDGLDSEWSETRHAATLACQALLAHLTSLTASDSTTTTSNSTSTSRDTAATIATGSLTPSHLSSHEIEFTPSTLEFHLHAVPPKLLVESWQDIFDGMWKVLLPRLCMNRHHPAEAVLSLSRSIWRDLSMKFGRLRNMVGMLIAEVCTYFCSMTRAKNHMTAEAACHAIAEMCASASLKTCLRSHLKLIFSTLCESLKDERWPVRDAAIVATGILIHYHVDALHDVSLISSPISSSAEEGRIDPSLLSVGENMDSDVAVVSLIQPMVDTWTAGLQDFIWSVREHAAGAFGEALQCRVERVQEHLFSCGMQYVRLHMHSLATIPGPVATEVNTQTYSSLPTAAAAAAVAVATTAAEEANVLRKNFLPISMLQQAGKKNALHMASLTTLDPNHVSMMSEINDNNKGGSSISNTSVRRKAGIDSTTQKISGSTKSHLRMKWGCCIDCIELRTCQPWEILHGSIYLLREIMKLYPAVLWQPARIDQLQQQRAELFFEEASQCNDTVKFNISEDTLWDVLLQLLVTTPTLPPSELDSTLAHQELLLINLYAEIPIFVLTAVNYLRTIPLPTTTTTICCFSSSSSSSSNDSSGRCSGSEDSLSNQDQHILQVLKLEQLVRALIRDAKINSGDAPPPPTTTTTTTTTTAAAAAAAATISTMKTAQQKRTEQQKRKRARAANKLLQAAEKCLIQLVDHVFVDANVRLRDRFLSYFSEDDRRGLKEILDS